MKLVLKNYSIINYSLLIICIILGISFASCDKENVENNEPVEKDTYYVKYTISARYPRIFSDWSASTPDGTYRKDGYQTRGWTETFGPLKRGFKCIASVGGGEATVNIHVSKNDEPFVLKASGMNHARYVIDF